MGVHGLTTYLRENRRALSSTIQFGTDSRNSVPIVVDGWSFIYSLSNSSGLPWVYGGEYHDFEKAVKSVVEAWITVGLTVHFVFDGPYPDIKFPTLVTRLGQSHVQAGLLFFRTSQASRATARSLAETWMLPPLTYTVCLHALKHLQSTTPSLHLHFADEEGDPYAVELAGRIGGYVVGNDSDFVILNSEGYLGYIPIDEMVWQTPSPVDEAPVDQDDSGFQIVRKPKANQKAAVLPSLTPPSEQDSSDLVLHLTAYSPAKLAQHLKIPITLLPLLGALVGNDFSSQSESHRRRLQHLFFDRNLSLTARIEHAASVVRAILTPGSIRRKSKQEIGSVMDLIDRTVNALLARRATDMGPGEVEEVINGVVEATLQYAIPRSDPQDLPLWPTKICALHAPDTCPFLPMVSRRLLEELQDMDEENQALLSVREILIDAYRVGSLSPKIMDPLNTSSAWPRSFLEHPDLEAVSRSITRPIRGWIYSILDDAVGLPDSPLPPPQEQSEPAESTQDEEEEDEDEDEVIDVVEEHSDDDDADPLAPLKNELQHLHHSDDDSDADPPLSSVTSSHPRKHDNPPTIAEYVRKGTRIASEQVKVAPLQQLLESIDLEEFVEEDAPLLLLRPEEDRLGVLLKLLQSDTRAVRALPSTELAPVLAARWVGRVLLERAEATSSKERDKERWTTAEVRSWLATIRTASVDAERTTAVPIMDRSIQLTAQMLAVLDAIDQLAQVLLIEHRIPSPAHLFSGRRFHAFLNEPRLVSLIDVDDVWHAVSEDLPGAFQEPKAKKNRKAKGSNRVKINGIKPPQATKKPQGFFALLGED
ncbi:hypothetical protein BKA70DRAFT_662533 [Coprinopsis sp. MPI-PUGE-AT-0042]|nr:hypothetical protein BKA70DRAFT_662533 [Coprinopsis sp. MPI-PUGE-AT-0042]